MAESKVKVAVRVRPFNRREAAMQAGCVVEMRGKQTILRPDFTKDGESKPFTFDESMWSHDPNDEHFKNQEQVFNELGREVLDNAFAGYNACIFAYGQTGSGKTYTMMGAPGDPGIIPRLCQALFTHADSKTTADLSYAVEVSYMEIYNEEVRDLLSAGNRNSLRVREHKVLGPYVEGLTKLAVQDFETIEMLMDQGNKLRKTAATKMNDTSSRSHAVFTLFMTERWYDKATNQTGEKASRIALVDLAGSERQNKTGATGARLKEGANINKSLSTLGLVIKALADQSAGVKKRDKNFVPYRNSVLTWLLKDNLGGNAKTVMVAAISPSSEEQDETLTTLRYADSAKRIVNRAVVNEDPNARMIRELKEELEELRNRVGSGGSDGASSEEMEKLRAQLKETEGMLAGMDRSWEQKLKDSQQVLREHKALLSEHGASVKGEAGALKLESRHPHLVTVSTGLDFGIGIYTIREGMTRVGLKECLDPPQDITLTGEGIDDEHCILEFAVSLNEETRSLNEVVSLHPIGDCYVNGEFIDDTRELMQSDAVQFGEANLFRFNHPTQALLMRQQGVQLPNRPAVLHSEMAAAARAEEQTRVAKEQMRVELENEKEMIRLERERLAATNEAAKVKQQAEFERQQQAQRLEATRAVEAANSAAAKIADEKTNENAVLMARLAEMEAKLKMEEGRRRDDERLKAARQVEQDEQTRLRREAIQKQREDELAVQKSMEREEARKLQELKATLEAERHDLEELERLRRMQREAAHEEHERILAQQREQLDNDRKAADSARVAAQTAEREAMLERERASERRAEAEELSRLHELEMDKNRIEQERIRAHQLKMAAIDDARRQAEQSKLELQRLRAQEQQMGLGSQPESHGYASAVAASSAASDGRGGGADSPAAAMEGQLAAMRAQFAARQATPEVQQAGKKDDTDRKIEKFEAAKRAYLNKQQAKAPPQMSQLTTPPQMTHQMSRQGSVLQKGDQNAENFLQAKRLFLQRQKEKNAQPQNPFGSAPSKGGAAQDGAWNPFSGKPKDSAAGTINPELVEPDEVVKVDIRTYVQERAFEKKTDANSSTLEGDRPEWLAHQWEVLHEQPWFRGFCGRGEAESELKRNPSLGAFVVRVSESKPGHYAISVLQRDSKSRPKVEHMLVLPSYAGRDPSAPGGTRYRLGETSRYLFNSVSKLVAFYNSRPYHTNNNKLNGTVYEIQGEGQIRYEDE